MLVGDWDSVTNFYLTQSVPSTSSNRAEIAQALSNLAEKYALRMISTLCTPTPV
jgi:hypothetical protein